MLEPRYACFDADSRSVARLSIPSFDDCASLCAEPAFVGNVFFACEDGTMWRANRRDAQTDLSRLACRLFRLDFLSPPIPVFSLVHFFVVHTGRSALSSPSSFSFPSSLSLLWALHLDNGILFHESGLILALWILLPGCNCCRTAILDDHYYDIIDQVTRRDRHIISRCIPYNH